ncbi:MAG: chemotaxis protein CheC [Gallionellaceae bacterium]|nr:chemotaxis protein CheC [Gallionellaceae bacterium]
MTLHISDIQKNALIEIFNIGVGQAANSLSQIVGEVITPSVPTIAILHSDDQADAISTITRKPRICAVSQDFTGGFDARAFLIFPEGKTREIVRRMLGESVSADELSKMEQEALCEIGNIILNSCSSALSDILHISFHSSIPAYHLGFADEILFAHSANNDDLLILCHIDFSIPSARSDGYLVFLLSPPSFNMLTRQVEQFLLGID